VTEMLGKLYNPVQYGGEVVHLGVS
jgi:hypothetical protein